MLTRQLQRLEQKEIELQQAASTSTTTANNNNTLAVPTSRVGPDDNVNYGQDPNRHGRYHLMCRRIC